MSSRSDWDRERFEQALIARRISRRKFLIGTGALTGLALAGGVSGAIAAGPVFSGYPFTLGVASGDPLPDSVVLWTRLAPDPVRGGGMPPRNVPVHWRVATDEGMRRVVRRGTVVARPELAHAVHADVRGLAPDRWYYYQFEAGAEVSPVGRTRTAPAPGAPLDRLRFAFVSC